MNFLQLWLYNKTKNIWLYNKEKYITTQQRKILLHNRKICDYITKKYIETNNQKIQYLGIIETRKKLFYYTTEKYKIKNERRFTSKNNIWL